MRLLGGDGGGGGETCCLLIFTLLSLARAQLDVLAEKVIFRFLVCEKARSKKLCLSSGVSSMKTFHHNLLFCDDRLLNYESWSARLQQ